MKFKRQKLRSFCLLLNSSTTIFLFAADATTTSLPERRECGEQLAMMNLQKAPPSPRTALRQARAQNRVAGREIVEISPLVVEAALHVQKNTRCCGCIAACCVALCKGDCYQPSEEDMYSARRKFEREENEQKAATSPTAEK